MYNKFVRLPETDERIELFCDRFPNMRFPSRIQCVRDKYLVASAPFVGGDPLRLKPKERVVVRWRNDCLLIAAALHQPQDGLSIELEVLEVLSHQRRSYFRWSITLPLRFHSQKENCLWFNTRTLDISGGGLGFVWEEPLKLGDRLNLHLSFEHAALKASGRVVNVRINRAITPSHVIAVEFTNIREADRSRIVSFIFRRQCAARADL